MDATARALHADENGERVVAIDVASLSGARKRIRAERFVLANGAVEISRLLLASPAPDGRGLANGRDVVGRYLMDHPCLFGLRLRAERPDAIRAFYDFHDHDGQLQRGYFTLTETAQRDHRLLNVGFRVHDDYIGEGGFAALRDMARAWRRRRGAGEIARAGLGVVADPLGAYRGARARSRRERLSEDGFVIRAQAEQAPSAASRIKLGVERDAVGMRRAEVDWRIDALDERSLRAACALLANDLERAGLGRTEMFDWLDGSFEDWAGEFDGGTHMMGGARMGDDPASSVVDRDLKVHGLDNLWVCGGAVFPTGGWINPTLTIVALADRLGDRLNASSQGGRRSDVTVRAA